MAGIITIDLPWESQPQELAEVRLESSLIRGMLCLYTPPSSRKSLIPGFGDLTVAGTPTTKPSETGIGFYGGSSSNYWKLPEIYSRTHHGVGTGEVTLIAIVKSNTTADQGGPFETTDTTDNDHYYYGGVIYYSAFSASRWVSGAASKVPITQEHVIVIRCKSGTKEFWQNGLLLGSGTGNTYTYNGADGPHIGKSKSNGWDGQVPLIGILDRYITDEELALLRYPSAVYGELFAPQSIPVPVSAGGGTSIAGALGTATASGYTGTVNANRTIAGALGTATASGFQGAVSNSTDTTITGALGIAAASGFAGTVGANRGIAGALGTAVASGFTGTVSNTNDTVIGGTLGIAIASGLIGGVNANRTIAGVLGTAQASGFTGSVSNGSTTDLALILKILRNRQELNPATGTFTLYDDDSTTVLYTASAWADAAGTVPYSGGALRRIDALV